MKEIIKVIARYNISKNSIIYHVFYNNGSSLTTKNFDNDLENFVINHGGLVRTYRHTSQFFNNYINLTTRDNYSTSIYNILQAVKSGEINGENLEIY